MKKLLILFAICLLPFGVIADLLPEPSDLGTDNVGGTTENIVDEEAVEEQESIDESSVEKEADESENTDENLREVDVKANAVSEDSGLHEIGEDGGLKRVSFGFCNAGLEKTSETLNHAINQGEPFKVCFTMSNSANQDIKIRVRVVDLIDGLCSVNDTSIHQFISEDDLKDLEEFVIPAGNYIVKEFNILYPIGIEGDQGGCTIFNIIKGEEAKGNVAAVVNRAYPMRFFVGTLDDVKNIINVDNIELSLDDNKDLIMNFDIKNEGNLENLVELSGTVSNMFGYSKKFSIEGGHVLPGNHWHVEANLGSIPSYGGLFNIDFKAFATPYFSYDISKSSIDPTLIEMKTFDFSTKYFKMPWLIIAIVIVVILLLITIFRKPKQKVIYVQQPEQPEQPVQGQQVPQQYYPQQNIPQQTYPQQDYPQQSVQQQPAQPQVQQPTQQQIQQPVQPQQPIQNQQVGENQQANRSQQTPDSQDSLNQNIQ